MNKNINLLDTIGIDLKLSIDDIIYLIFKIRQDTDFLKIEVEQLKKQFEESN